MSRRSITDAFPTIVITPEPENEGKLPDKSLGGIRRTNSNVNLSDINKIDDGKAQSSLISGSKLELSEKLRRCNSFSCLPSACLEDKKEKINVTGTPTPRRKTSHSLAQDGMEQISGVNGHQQKNDLVPSPRVRRKSDINMPVSTPAGEKTPEKGPRHSLTSKPSSSREPSPNSMSRHLSITENGAPAGLSAGSQSRSRDPSPSTKTSPINLEVLIDRRRQKSLDRSRSHQDENDGPYRKNSKQLTMEEAEQILQSSKHIELDKSEVKQILASLEGDYKKQNYFSVTYSPMKRSDSKQSLSSLGSSSSDDSGGFSSKIKSASWKESWRNGNAGTEPGEIKAIRGMCFTNKGLLAVTEEKNSRVQLFNKSGKSLKILKGRTTVRRMQPGGICQSPNKNLLSLTDLHRVVYLDPADGDFETGVLIDKKTDLAGIETTRNGKLILTNIGLKPSVGVYETEGTVVREFKLKDLKKPLNVSFSHELGIIFVADSELGTVFMLDEKGEIINKLGRDGEESVRLVYPIGISCFPSGRVAVLDKGNNRLVVYDLRARAVDHLLTSDHGLQNPSALASDGIEGIAIAEENQDWKLDEYKLKYFKPRSSKTRKSEM